MGIDIEKISRFNKSYKENKMFFKKIFLENEIKYCLKKRKNTAASFAGIFCAKEATIKACANTVKLGLKDIRIEPKKDRAILISVKKLPRVSFLSSISHSADFAIAMTIMLPKKRDYKET
ncbi:MAG: 4'-phosphopantetheinyl transferase superfamily protein [Candidatus Diapherotrites archaeon]|nr:4'-phosphopantetheinyl transferase superfamily protein [Candidatus Diapherotrites archaeon]